MARFVTTKYEADSGLIHPIRLRSDGVAAAGTAPTGAIDSDINARSRKGGREFGLRARGWRLARDVGTAPNEFTRYSFVPRLTLAQYNATLPETVTAYGATWRVIGRSPEDVD